MRQQKKKISITAGMLALIVFFQNCESPLGQKEVAKDSSGNTEAPGTPGAPGAPGIVPGGPTDPDPLGTLCASASYRRPTMSGLTGPAGSSYDAATKTLTINTPVIQTGFDTAFPARITHDVTTNGALGTSSPLLNLAVNCQSGENNSNPKLSFTDCPQVTGQPFKTRIGISPNGECQTGDTTGTKSVTIDLNDGCEGRKDSAGVVIRSVSAVVNFKVQSTCPQETNTILNASTNQNAGTYVAATTFGTDTFYFSTKNALLGGAPAAAKLVAIKVPNSLTASERLITNLSTASTGSITVNEINVPRLNSPSSVPPTDDAIDLNISSMAAKNEFVVIGVKGSAAGAGTDALGRVHLFRINAGVPEYLASYLGDSRSFGDAVLFKSATEVLVSNTNGSGAITFFDITQISNVYNFVPQYKIVSASPRANEYFGRSMALSGSDLFIGAPISPTFESASLKGRVYKINFSGLTKDSVNVPSYTASGIIDAPISPLGFGESIAVNASWIAVGAPRYTVAATATTAAILNTGLVYIYDKNSPTYALIDTDGAGTLNAIAPQNKESQKLFGAHVQFDPQGSNPNMLWIGSPGAGMTGMGGHGSIFRVNNVSATVTGAMYELKARVPTNASVGTRSGNAGFGGRFVVYASSTVPAQFEIFTGAPLFTSTATSTANAGIVYLIQKP